MPCRNSFLFFSLRLVVASVRGCVLLSLSNRRKMKMTEKRRDKETEHEIIPLHFSLYNCIIFVKNREKRERIYTYYKIEYIILYYIYYYIILYYILLYYIILYYIILYHTVLYGPQIYGTLMLRFSLVFLFFKLYTSQTVSLKSS